MCGIVGYIGEKKAAPILLKGLGRLEYRGYDSAGVCIIENGNILIEKSAGRLKTLSEKIGGGEKYSATAGIGHTRWATHGEPSDVNSHPHTSRDKLFTVVHNGIIENYAELKETLINKDYSFLSDTDTEVIAHLLYDNYDDDILKAINKTAKMLKGSYALGIIFKNTPDVIYALRRESPLIVGAGDDGNYIASDVPAILEYTRSVYYLENDELALITKNSVCFYDGSLNKIEKELKTVELSVDAAQIGGYKHFMLKEIFEQPEAISKTILPRIKGGDIYIEGFSLSREELLNFSKIYIVACGSAYHVGIVGKYTIEKMCRIPVEVDVASEFRYRNPLIDEKTLFIAISQSGETADTLAAMREAKRKGAKTVAVVNVVGSSIARECDIPVYTWAGPEIAVATTKAYSAQLSVIYLLSLYMGSVLGRISEKEKEALIRSLKEIPQKTEKILADADVIRKLGEEFKNAEDVFFIGRGVDYALSLEGSLKLKEISYIHSEAYPAGELKHGTISLIEKGTLVVALATEPSLFEKTASNIKEVKARGAKVFLLTTDDRKVPEDIADFVYKIPSGEPSLLPSLLIIPLQLLAYYIALNRDCDIDKPRNLAKSVTVE